VWDLNVRDDGYVSPEQAEETNITYAITTAANCLKDTVIEHYGLDDAVAAALTLAGAPVYKGWVPPFRVIGSPSTTPLSIVGHFLEIEAPRIASTTNLLRAAGRISGPLGVAMLAYDTASILVRTVNCYNQKTGGSAP
jgi:hypothetical protein